jgi:hypothetical protein
VNSHVVALPAQGGWFWGPARITRHLPASTSARDGQWAISQPSLELIRAGFDAFNRGNHETGRVAWTNAFPDRTEALEAAGLRE